MSLLARVAERIYWGSRYLERAENSARTVTVQHRQLLDLPAGASASWQTVIATLGANETFRERFDDPSDKLAMWYLVGDEQNPSSVARCIRSAKENFRTARDILPQEAWHAVTELELVAQRKLRRRLAARSWCEALDTIVEISQRINGLLAGSMSRGLGYQFLLAGRHLERMDMVTRVLDNAVLRTSDRRSGSIILQRAIWRGVLLSLSAYQMYRQQVRRQIYGRNVIDFLLTDENFPRAVHYNLDRLKRAIISLPRPRAAREALAPLFEQLAALDDLEAKALDAPAVRRWIDAFQADLAGVHHAIEGQWFPSALPLDGSNDAAV